MENNRNKHIKLILVLSLAISICLCFVFVFNVTRVKKLNIKEYQPISINDNYEFTIESNNFNDKVILSGYIYSKTKTINSISSKIVIKDGDSYNVFPTSTVYVSELENNDKKNRVAWSGFKSTINNNIDGDVYILLEINGNYELIDLMKNIGEIINNEKEY